jgi:hypothetical protein
MSDVDWLESMTCGSSIQCFITEHCFIHFLSLPYNYLSYSLYLSSCLFNFASNSPDASVTFSIIRFGPIDSTY